MKTEEEALQEAKSFWGERGLVKYRTDWQSFGRGPYAVGVIQDELFKPFGEGNSWEEAFKRAKSKKRRRNR